MQLKTGINDNERQTLAEELAKILADTYTLYLKTQYFHWNVTGPLFDVHHKMFEKQYEDLAQAVDDIAERIRALGEYAPGSYAQFSKLATIKEATEVPKADDMLKQLLSDHETMCRHLHELIKKSESANDDATADMLIERLQTHEKTAWMLRASLEG